jgi:putative SOS response-associated peptidase YedK
MAKRIAFFATKEEIENYYSLSTNRENLFEPHYNLSPGQHIPVITRENGDAGINRVRWGDESNNTAVITTDAVQDEIKKRGVLRCIIPMSGFFVWKDDLEKDHPFFVRMLNGPVMSCAGLMYGKNGDHIKIVSTKSNVLVQPMSPTMPLLLDRDLSFLWLNSDHAPEEVISKAAKLFLFTDLSVMRVSKKVNDPKNNDANLIQPIPK